MAAVAAVIVLTLRYAWKVRIVCVQSGTAKNFRIFCHEVIGTNICQKPARSVAFFFGCCVCLLNPKLRTNMSEGKTGHPVGGAETKRYEIVEAAEPLLGGGSQGCVELRGAVGIRGPSSGGCAQTRWLGDGGLIMQL